MEKYLKEYNVSDYFSISVSYGWKVKLNTFELIHMDENCFLATGYTAEEFMNNKLFWLDRVHPDDRDKFIEARNRGDLNKLTEIEYRAKHKNGKYQWLNNKYCVVNFPNPDDSIVVGVTMDISANKEAALFLEHRIKLEEILATTSASFVNIEDHNFDEHVNKVLEDIGKFADTDRAYLFLYHGELMSNTHEWVADGVSVEKDNLQNIPINVLPWWNTKMKESKMIYLHSLDELPPEAYIEKEVLAAQSIQSLLVMPLIHDNEIIGFMGFDSVKKPMLWSRQDLILLRTICEITANAIKRKEQSEKLKETELRFRQMAESVTEVFYLSDPREKKILYISPSFEEIWGISVQKLYDYMPAFVDSVIDEDKAQVIQMLEMQSAGNITDVEYRIQRPDGSIRWIRDRAFPIFDDQRTVVRVSGIADDITKYKSKEEELRSSEELYRSLIESSDAIILMIDRNNQITFANKVTLEKFNTSYKDIIGKSMPDFVSEAEAQRYSGLFQSVFERNEQVVVETELTINGRLFCTRNSIVPIRDNSGYPTHLLVNALEITELLQAQKIIHRSNERLKGLQLVDRAIIQGGLNEEPAELAAIRFLNQMVPCDELDIILFDEEQDLAKITTRIKDNIEYSDESLRFPLELFESSNLFLGKTLEINIEEYKDVELAKPLIECGYTKALLVPMMVHGNNIGLLLLLSKDYNFFVKEYVEISEEVANQIALSFYHSNLYKQIRKYSEELEANVEQRTKDIVLISNTYKAIMNNTDISIIIVDEQGKLIECNPATYCKLGLTPDTFSVNKSTEFIHEPSSKVKMCVEVLGEEGIHFGSSIELFKYKITNGLPNTFEWNYLTNNGGKIPVLLTVNTLITDDSNTKRYVLIASDITEQKNAESQLKDTLEREIELGKFKSSFVTTASHQFRTPLTSIQSSVELIEFYLSNINFDKKDKTLHHIKLINTEIQKFSDLMSDILTIGKIEEGKIPFNPAQEDIKQLIHEVIDTYFSTKSNGRTIDFITEDGNYSVLVDKRLITHAILNLISNALKYSKGNPIIKLYNSNGFVYIEVIDNGIGIPPDEINNLFQSFYRASNSSSIEGTGLGLAIVKEFVTIHHGQIFVESSINKGSTFTIKLP